MKTRSHATIHNTTAGDSKRNPAKRKRKEDGFAAGDGGDRSKRQRFSNQSQGKSPLCGPADAAMAAEVFPANNERCTMTLENFVGGLRKSRATGSRCISQDPKSSLLQSTPFAGRDLQSGEQRRSGDNISEEHPRRNDLTSTEGDAVQPCSSGFVYMEGDDVQHHEENLSLGQGGSDEQDNPTSNYDKPVGHGEDNLRIVEPPISPQDVQHHEDNMSAGQGGLDEQHNITSNFDEPIHHVKECDRIVESPISPQEMAGVQFQSQEGYHQNEGNPTFTGEGAGKRSSRSCRHKNKDALFCRNSLDCRRQKSRKSIREEQYCPGVQKTSRKRRLEEQAHSCPNPGKRRHFPGSIKRVKNQRKEGTVSMSTRVPKEPNPCFSRKRLHAAKLRWKNLAQSILKAKAAPEIPACDLAEPPHGLLNDNLHRHNCPTVGEQIICVENRQSYETQPLPKIRRQRIAEQDPSAPRQRLVTWRMREKVRRQHLSLQKGMKSWLTKAKFSQITKEQSNGLGEAFIMTQDERHAFAQTMVKSCQKNSNLRTLFLESVRMLTLSGLMQTAASNLLQQGSCEEVQHVLDAWADFKGQSAMTKNLPMNLLHAVNQLHEKRGDLLTKLCPSKDLEICTLSPIDEKTWKFQLPGFHVEDEDYPV